MATAIFQQRNAEATVHVGDLDERVDEALLWELFLQVGPVSTVYIPKDKLKNDQRLGFGFVEFQNAADAIYALKVLNMVRLFGRPLKLSQSLQNDVTIDIGANLFVGGLDPSVDEKLLYDTFSSFGNLSSAPHIGRDADTGEHRGFGFVNFDSFEAADAAIAAMSGQFLCNRQITVQYALKRGSQTERCGSQTDRLIAANARAARQSLMTSSAAAAAAGAPAPPLGAPSMMPPPSQFAVPPPALPPQLAHMMPPQLAHMMPQQLHMMPPPSHSSLPPFPFLPPS